MLIGAYAAIGLVAIGAAVLLDGRPRAGAYLLVSLLPVIGIVAGIVMHRPRVITPWLLFLIGQGLFFAGDLLWFEADLAGQAEFPSIADAFYLLGYPALAAGMATFIRYRRPRHALRSMIDAAAVGVAVVLVLWLVVIEAVAHDQGMPLAERLLLMAYPIGDGLLLAGAATLLLGQAGGFAARRVLLLALALLVAADSIYSIVVAEDAYAAGLGDTLWLASYLLFGVAALLPSMRGMTEPDESLDRPGHLYVLLVAGIVVPFFAVAQQLLVGHVDVDVVLVAETFLAALLLVRVVDMHRTGLVARAQLRHQAHVLANIRESVIVSDLAGTVTYWSSGAEHVFGYRADEMIGRSVAVLYPDVDVARLGADLAQILAGADYERDWEGRRRDGSRVIVSVHTSVLRDERGVPTGFIGVASDVTERRYVERQALRLASAIEQATEMVVMTNTAGEIEFVNPAFEATTGYRAAEVIGHTPSLLKSGHQPPAYYAAMWATLKAGRPWRGDFVNRRKDGSTYEATAVITPIRDLRGAIDGYVAVSRDVTEERAGEVRAQRLARERVLVGQTLRDLDQSAPPEDNARAISRQLASLSDIATAGLSIFTADGRAAPYGFTVNGNDIEPTRAVPRKRSEYLRARAAAGPWIEIWHDRPDHPYNDLFTALGVRAIAYAPVRSGTHVIGFLHASSTAVDADETLTETLPALVEFADIAGALVAQPIGLRHVRDRARGEIARIIRERLFTPVYQPIFDVANGQITGYEALTRFDSGSPPDLVIAEATTAGLGMELELALIESAIEIAGDLPIDLWLNLNISPETVLRSRGRLRSIIDKAGRDIVLEITEHSQITDYGAFRRAVGRLGGRVRLAVDDAGSGYASLRHILELRPELVKLDRLLIQGIGDDDARRALVAGICHFATLTGYTVIAEGVEAESELQALREIGVRLAQGYLLGRPETRDQINGRHAHAARAA